MTTKTEKAKAAARSVKASVKKAEPKVDAGITKVQAALEALKQSPKSAWILMITGIIGLVAAAVIWFS